MRESTTTTGYDDDFYTWTQARTAVLRSCTLCLLLLALSGCVVRPDQETMARADYGAYPTAYEQIITAFMQRLLRDPDSAKYRFVGNPRQYFYGMGREPHYGWRVCATINAKNAYGGYVGEKPYFFLLRDGAVQKYEHVGFAVQALCEDK